MSSSNTASLARTQDEIVARIAEVEHDDHFGFRREALFYGLDYEHAKPFLREGVTEDQWAGPRDPIAEGRDYLAFAIDKIVDHRGISAHRSVEKLREFAWLAGRDDVVSAMDAADYPNYGAPQVKAFAEGMGFPWPGDVSPECVAWLDRMSRGESCEPRCDAGCAE